MAEQQNTYWRWVPLIFSSFFFLPIGISYPQITTEQLVWAITVYCSFIFLFYQSTTTSSNNLPYWLLATLLLCTLGTWVTPGTQALFGYIAFFCGLSYSLGKALAGFGIIVLAIFTSAMLFDQVNMYFILPALLTSTGCVFFGYSTQKDLSFKAINKRNQAHIEQLAAIAERERIARDLHDIIGHSLTSIALKADLAQQFASNNQTNKALEQIQEVASLSRETLGQVREAITGLKEKGLTASLQELSNRLKQHGFTVNLDFDKLSLPAQLEASITLILTEAVTNILRHSSGNHVLIALSRSLHGVKLFIADNGSPKPFTFNNGLNGIKARCRELNGKFTLNTTKEFSLNIFLPMPVDES